MKRANVNGKLKSNRHFHTVSACSVTFSCISRANYDEHEHIHISAHDWKIHEEKTVAEAQIKFLHIQCDLCSYLLKFVVMGLTSKQSKNMTFSWKFKNQLIFVSKSKWIEFVEIFDPKIFSKLYNIILQERFSRTLFVHKNKTV